MLSILYHDNNVVELCSLDNKAMNIIIKHFTFEINRFQIKNKNSFYGNRKPTICMIKYRKYMPYGLINELIDICKKNNIEYELDNKIVLTNKISLESVVKFVKSLEPVHRPYPHQIRAVYKALKHKRIVLKSATSSGKSFIIYVLSMFFNNTNDKTLIIVPGAQLVGQLYEDFIEYSENNGIKTHEITKMFHGGTDKEFNKNILISTYQTLVKMPDVFFKQFKYVILDEAHSGKSYSVQQVTKKCINADYRIGMTGSLDDRKDASVLLDKFNIMGAYGHEYKVITSRELIDKNMATDVEIHAHALDEGTLEYNFSIDDEIQQIKNNTKLTKVEKTRKIKSLKEVLYRRELQRIYFNSPNEQLMYEQMDKYSDKNSLIVFHQTEYGKKLFAEMKERYPDKKIFYVDGNIKLDDRHGLCDTMEKNDDVIGVVSIGTFKQGISIKNLHYIILCQVWKAPNALIQLIGRGMRKHKNKKKVIIVDFCRKMQYVNENGVKIRDGYLLKHFTERLRIYKKEKHPIKMFKHY